MTASWPFSRACLLQQEAFGWLGLECVHQDLQSIKTVMERRALVQLVFPVINVFRKPATKSAHCHS